MRSLTVKLVLAFWAVSLVGIVVGMLFAGQFSLREIDNLSIAHQAELVAAHLQAYYQARGSWAGLSYADFNSEIPPGSTPDGSPDGLPPNPFFTLVDPQGNVIFPDKNHFGKAKLTPEQLASGQSISVNGAVVGILVSGSTRPNPRPPVAAINQRLTQELLAGGLAATTVSLVLGIVLARTFLRPIQMLTRATQTVAQGDFETPVPVQSKDEIGALAHSFNEMLAQLKRSRDLRRQMTADIAHELRTPLSLILGHTEAMSDGVLPPTSETLNVIYDEARQLTRLVEDLRTLSLSETGDLSLVKNPILPAELITGIAAAYSNQAERQGLAFGVDVPVELPEITVDCDRIGQVLRNLLDNAFRYTPVGGRVTLSAGQADDGVEFRVQDSGPGIAPNDLPNIFERFYRGDKSRQRPEGASPSDGAPSDGGSGLGLAIAKSLVELHQGKIWAESEPGTGATFVVWLPVGVSD